jgi:phosphoadenosine phosphosulfate reductase
MAFDLLRQAVDPDAGLAAEARLLAAEHAGETAEAVLAAAIGRHYAGRIALVSSFGADSAVLLDLVARIDRSTPVLVVDTGKLFPETLRYRDALVERLGLDDVRTLRPDADELARLDPGGALWLSDTDRCCRVRKVAPLDKAVRGFSAWITGRKRYQADTRSRLPLFEADGPRIKVNPLAGWTRADLEAYRAARDLPAHPLVAEGYPSIGCLPCTDRVRPGEDERAGRWRGQDKTECGIHLGLEAFGSGI